MKKPEKMIKRSFCFLRLPFMGSYRLSEVLKALPITIPIENVIVEQDEDNVEFYCSEDIPNHRYEEDLRRYNQAKALRIIELEAELKVLKADD